MLEPNWLKIKLVYESPRFEEGGFDVYQDNENEEIFYLYEIPQYGGEPQYEGSFSSKQNAIDHGNTFT